MYENEFRNSLKVRLILVPHGMWRIFHGFLILTYAIFQIESFWSDDIAYEYLLYIVCHHTLNALESHHGAGGVTKDMKRFQIDGSKFFKIPLISCCLFGENVANVRQLFHK